MKKALLTLFFAAIALTSYAQEFQVPKNYTLVTKEDYAPYEQDIVNCVNWLTSKSINADTDKRQEANAFLLKWLSGSPTVHVELKEEVVTFIGTSPDLLMIYLGGWARYALTSKEYVNKIEGSMAGIEAVIDFYQKNRDLMPRDKNVEKYIKLKEKGKLRTFITENA